MQEWIDATVGTFKLLFFLGVLVLFFHFFIAPKEEAGRINYSTLSTCAASVETERFSTATYFKTFTCNDNFSSGKNCYHLEMQNGVCTKSIYYYREPYDDSELN